MLVSKTRFGRKNTFQIQILSKDCLVSFLFLFRAPVRNVTTSVTSAKLMLIYLFWLQQLFTTDGKNSYRCRAEALEIGTKLVLPTALREVKAKSNPEPDPIKKLWRRLLSYAGI